MASGIVRMSENRIAASSGKRASGCSVTSVASEASSRARESFRFRARRVVFGQIAPCLAHQPYRRVRRGLAEQRAEKYVVFEWHRGSVVAAARIRQAGARPHRQGQRGARAVLRFSAAARCCPSGTDRRRARTAGLHGSPRPPATGRGACRRPRRLSAPTSDSLPCPRARCRADRSRRRAVRSNPSRTGPTKPIASSTRSAFISNSEPGTSTIFIAPSRPCAIRRAPRRASRLCPFAAFETLGRDRPVARAAFLVRRRGPQLDRPIRPDERLVLLLGRLRQELELGDRLRALAIRRADAIRTRVAAADDDHVLAGGQDLLRHLVARDDAVLLRQELHREMDARESRPGTGRSRGASAPPVSTTASYSATSCLRRRHPCRRARPGGIRRPRPTSAPCGGR